MCVVCGCSNSGAAVGEAAQVNPATGDLHFGAGAARVSVPGMSAERAIKLEADVLGENNLVAAANRRHFADHGVTALNLVSSPGSGKTTLLCATIHALRTREPGVEVAVIEGDQQTSNDADRIRATGAPAIQVNTGKGCHLDAPMVAAAFARLPLHGHGHTHAADHAHPATPGADHAHAHTHAHSHDHGHAHGAGHRHGEIPAHTHDDTHDHAHAPASGADHDHADPTRLLFIENVGNLVCPAMWDLGEAGKVAILSVTEGEDKPIKYPDMFAAARLMVLNKIDLLPYLDFDIPKCIAYAQRVNPGIEVLLVSARSGQGMEAWLDWLIDAAHETAHEQAHRTGRAHGHATAPSTTAAQG